MALPSNTYNAFKLAQLRSFQGLHVAEVVAVYWDDGVKYYSKVPLHELPNFRNINLNGTPITVEGRLPGRVTDFGDMVFTSDIGDERVSLRFNDFDGEMTRRFMTGAGGEGVKVEFFYYFPQLDWMPSHWWGLMQMPSSVSKNDFTASAQTGFRSTQISVPRRMFQLPCQNTFGGALATQSEIDCHSCPYNRHIGGTVGLLDGPVPFTDCPKTEAGCVERLGNKTFYTGFQSQVIAIVIGQTHGPPTNAPSRGNETNLKRALRVIYGTRIVRDLDLLAMRQEVNAGNANAGFLAALFMICEGRVRSVSACSIINMLVGSPHLNTANGAKGQPRTNYADNVSNFSHTAHFFGRVGPLNPGGYNTTNTFGQCTIVGRDEIKIFTNETTFSRDYTTNTAWCLLDLYSDPLFGHGLDPSRFVITDWIDLADWCDDVVSFIDFWGTVWTGTRNTFNADIQGRTAQAQFRDICLWHRFTMPFQHNGKLRILPLKGLTPKELEVVPVFYTDGDNRNIQRDDNGPMLSWSQKKDGDLPNQIVVVFEETNAALGLNNVERPITFGQESAQLAAGRAFGDTTLRVIEQRYQAFGIINEAEVMRKGNMLLDLGEFDEGGLKNNFRIKFTCTFASGFELHQYQVLRIDSAFIANASATLQDGGFKYYRVIKKTRKGDLGYEVEAQAYPELYWADVESTITPGGGPSPYAYEAEDEDNELFGSAELLADADCSGGFKAIQIGNGGDSTDGMLRFNNVVADDGTALVSIWYKTDTTRSLKIRANSDSAKTVLCPTSAGDTPRKVTVVLEFHAGSDNTVTIFNPAGECPDIDRIFVVPYEIDPGGGGPCRPGLGEMTYVNGRAQVPVLPC